MEQQIKDFIENNNLTFEPGRRNSDSCILSGYALHLGMKNANKLESLIEKYCENSEDFQEEFNRVYNYASQNNYGKFWTTEEARKEYKF